MRFLVLLGLISVVALASLSAGQAAVTENMSVPVDTFTVIPCIGDTVDLTGRLHILVSFTSNNNSVSETLLFNPQGITGVDLTTGTTYRLAGETLDQFSSSLINGQTETTFVDNFPLIGHGSATDYRVHVTTHVTINADGTTTANIDNMDITCG
jgi:hypothetical protein